MSPLLSADGQAVRIDPRRLKRELVTQHCSLDCVIDLIVEMFLRRQGGDFRSTGELCFQPWGPFDHVFTRSPSAFDDDRKTFQLARSAIALRG